MNYAKVWNLSPGNSTTALALSLRADKTPMLNPMITDTIAPNVAI